MIKVKWDNGIQRKIICSTWIWSYFADVFDTISPIMTKFEYILTHVHVYVSVCVNFHVEEVRKYHLHFELSVSIKNEMHCDLVK